MRRVGEIYRIRLSDGNVGYMQHLANDSTQLSSNVVLVLRKKYLPTEEPSFEQVSAHDGFFAHVFLKAGETLKLWERIDRSRPVVPEPFPVVWTIYSDKDQNLEVSKNWQVWRTNEEMRMPISQEELVNSELGLVVSPTQIVHRIEHSAYSLKHPRRA